MTLDDQIQGLFPGIRRLFDYRLQDDGKGPYISAWTYPLAPQPTAEQLASAPAPVPQTVAAVQARLALTAAGKRSEVETAVANATQDVQDYWQFSMTIGRQHPVLLQMAQSLGWTSADLDALFVSAAQIPT
jgi:hypothetical protein